MKITTRILVACLPGIVAGALYAASTGDQTISKTKANEAALSKAKASMDKLPLSFEPNRGQTDSRVQFLSRGPGYTVFFTKDETVLALKDTKTSNAVVRMRFVGGTNSGSAQPLEALPSYANYMSGNDSSKWLTDVKEYSKLRYNNVYPGIDVVYQGDHQQLRYDFVVKPGASASAIAMAYEGADNIAVNKDGDLVLTIGGKTLITRRPFTYQEEAGAKKEIASHFVVKDGRVSIELAKYDTAKDVVIDPSVIFISYLGGNLNDSVNGVAIVNTFQTVSTQPSFYYVTGTTASTNFPGTTGEFQAALAGANDVFVSKITFNGATLVWSTYLGGNSQDASNAIAVDTASPVGSAGSAGGTGGCTVSGCPVIVGVTFSLNFPLANAPSGNGLSGTQDAFASKLSSDGKTLLFSQYIGGITNDTATGVALDASTPPNIFVGGYTDSPTFPLVCPAGSVCANHGVPTSSSDAFVVKLNGAGAIQVSVLYGGFGQEFARGIAYNKTNNMIYIAGDTTTATQNFIAPNNVNLPGITNSTTLVNGGNALPGPGTGARGGFVAAFDATTMVKTFASYVAVSPNTGTCGTFQGTACNTGTESITGVAAEGGAPAGTCSTSTGVCSNSAASLTPTSNACASPMATNCIAQPYGNVGHVYLTGVTTSNVPTSNIAVVVPSYSCASALNATDGTTTGIKTGQTIALGCTTALVTQAPFNNNYANNTNCPYPLTLPLTPSSQCNLAAFVAILDGALLIQPNLAAPAPIGNQIEYWAYYSSVLTAPVVNAPNSITGMGNSSAVSNAIAIDTNPTTASSLYSLGYYQQMYITGSTTITTGTSANQLPTTSYPSSPNTNEIFTPYNVGTTTGGGVGGLNPNGQTGTAAIPNPTAAFIARFNPNGLAASAYGGFPNFGGNSTPVLPQVDRSPLLHTPQFNYGEFLYSVGGANNKSGTADTTPPSTIGNAIAVDITRAVLIGGVTNNSQATTALGAAAATCPGTPFSNSCEFTTSNGFTGATTFAGGTDGWVSVLFFNDILTDAPAISTADPFLEPGAPFNTNGQTYLQTSVTNGLNGQPPPFGPTFDFAISDLATQTQTFRVIFTGQTSGQLVGQTPFYVPLDTRSGANPPTFDTNEPGSGIVYYLPCWGPGGNPYPAPGSPYTPLGTGAPTNACPTSPFTIPALYQALNPGLSPIFSGWPGITPGTASAAPNTTPGWLLVSQDINPGVVRLQLDRRAAAGLLEGTYVAQFLVNTYDPNQNLNSSHPNQWPPCASTGISEINPFVPSPICTNALTPLPADNESILVTVRLVVRPTLFLSRNAGFLTGITSALSTNPLYGPVASLGYPGAGDGTTSCAPLCQDGTQQVPDWLYADSTSALTLGNPNTTAPAGPNSGPPVCVVGSVAGVNWNPTGLPGLPPPPTSILLPCPVNSTSAPAPLQVGGEPITYAAAAYTGNGPGDSVAGGLKSTPSSTPNITFLYDAGTVQSPNVAPQQGLMTSRPDSPQPSNAFNSDFQGGIDPETQRNDATVHDYYTTVEGAATLSVGAVNCTNWNANSGNGHNPSVGNWLAVSIGTSPLNGTPSSYLPICTDLSVTTIGTTKAAGSGTKGGVVRACAKGCDFTIPINDDSNVFPIVGGQKISLDFMTKAFSNRAAANGIPTGLYTAQVFVWSTRAKNSVPGYCLGASMPASPLGIDPVPTCGSLNGASPTGPATDNNPNPEIPITSAQTFNVTLYVFDTTQIIQITPNSTPPGGFVPGQPATQFVTVANSENLFTGNPLSGFGSPVFGPVYPQFGPNGDGLAVFSLLPFQTTGTAITQPCPGNNSASCIPPFAGQNFAIPLPTNVTVDPQTLAQYNACQLPTGKFNGSATFNGTAVNGSFVPGVGTLQQSGAVSQNVFVPATGSSPNVSIYVCRPTVPPAWLATEPAANTLPGGFLLTNSAGLVYPGNSTNAFAGAPEPWSSGNGPAPDPVPSTGNQTSVLGQGVGTTLMSGTKIGILRGNVFNFDSNGNESGPQPNDPADRADAFAPPGGVLSGDIAVTGDWTGTGHFAAGWFRPSTGQWWLDANNNGFWDGTGPGNDLAYVFPNSLGGANVPVIGDWAGLGKSAIGVVSNGFLWIEDLNADGVFQQPTCPGAAPSVWPNCGINTITGDAVFAFGAATDVPVVGNWNALTSAGGFPVSQAGMVRTYFVGGVAQSGPFLWMLDSAVAGTPSNVLPITAHGTLSNGFGTAFGGAIGDVPVAGDWNNTGVSQFGFFRSGFLWVLDGAPPLAPQGSHFNGFVFAYGGLAGDKPIVGKW